MPEMQKPGVVLTVVGILGVFISFIVQKGELDPTALGIAFASIFLAIIGISWVLGSPGEERKGKREHRRRKHPS